MFSENLSRSNKHCERTYLKEKKISSRKHWKRNLIMKNLNRTIRAESGNSSNRDSLLTHMEKKREDVVYKTIIRSVRRFYLKLFKDENPLLIRKRFRNVKSAVFYEAIKKMINRHINVQISSNLDTKNSLHTNASSDQLSWSHINKDLDTLIVFMFRFIGFKPKDKKKYGVEDEAIGKQVQSWMYNYSYPKFIQIWSITTKYEY